MRRQMPADVAIPFKIALDAETHAVLLTHLIKYLLYQRGQIPCIYDEVCAFVQREEERQATTKKRKLVHGSVKKAKKLVVLAETMFNDSLLPLFERHVKTVALVFGASLVSPREVWRVEFGELVGQKTDSEATGPGIPRDRLIRMCAQKLIRSVLAYATQHFASSMGVTSVHLVALAEKKPDLIPGFHPKQNFQLRLPKQKKSGVKRVHVVEISDLTQQPRNDAEPHCDYMWYQFERPLQGFSGLA